MKPTAHLYARLVQLASIAAAAAVLTACAADATHSQQPAPVTTPAKPAPIPAANPQSAAPQANAAQMLPQYLWSLTRVTGPDGQPLDGWLIPGKDAPLMRFENGLVGVRNLCNLVNASYSTNLDRIEIARPVSTMRACIEEGKMLQERKVLLQLPLAQRYEVFPAGNDMPSRMLLTFSDGVRWELTGSPTPQTRFGSEGRRMFLEVAPEKVDCNNPLMRKAKCLRVRDITFDAKGIKRAAGEWRILQGSIEGYNFEPGIRNVLRVDRYSLAKDGAQPADAPSHVYVLDMIVESERVR